MSDLFTVRDPDGYLIHTVISTDEEDCIQEFMNTESCMLSIYNLGMAAKGLPQKSFPTWEQYVKDGYSVVPIELIEAVPKLAPETRKD